MYFDIQIKLFVEMKKYLPLLILFVVCIKVNAQYESSKQTFSAPELKTAILNHKTVAIIPLKSSIFYKKMPKGMDAEMVMNEEKKMGYDMQSGMYTFLLRKVDNYTVSFQEVDRTNILLKKAGFAEKRDEFLPEDLCKILNVDAVIIATGNDFRAVEAGVHAYASRNGQYSSLSHAKIEDGIFTFWMEIPLALGTVGGLTSLHPLVKMTLEILGKPSAQELMQIAAVTGLAQNFAALRSLTTTGIQEGHMKMHINNILNQFQTTAEERKIIKTHFENNSISHASVVEFIETLRK